MSPDEARRLMEDVKANLGLLDACPGHRFTESLDAPGSRLRVRWRCSVCTGVVDASAKLWYERGRAHERARAAGA